MKTLYYSIIVFGSMISVLTYLLLVPVTNVISWDESSKTANITASQYGIFSHETNWHVHIAADGKINPSTGYDEFDQNSGFSCLFSVVPNDAQDHFAYLSVFRNNDTGYVVATDDRTGKVIDAKPVANELAVCGP